MQVFEWPLVEKALGSKTASFLNFDTATIGCIKNGAFERYATDSRAQSLSLRYLKLCILKLF